jgi:hypothetical protein
MISVGPAQRSLNELGFNSDWIEKSLAHEDGRSSRGIYNKAEYEHQRRHMMQEWANMVDAWVDGRKYIPKLYPSSMELTVAEPTCLTGRVLRCLTSGIGARFI